ncbi:hypothetical protein BH23BAC4_BH23BAC4_00600 [soil metagenome]
MRFSCLLVALAFLASLPASAQLSGTYTVGGASPDFANLATAVFFLNTQGVSGPVTLLLSPNVTHSGPITMNAIAGTSATNTVTIRPPLPVSHRARIEFDATSTTNYVFMVNGSSHIRFARIDFEETGVDVLYARVIAFGSGTTDITFDNCSFTGVLGGQLGFPQNLFATGGGAVAPSRITVRNSTFAQGWYGFFLPGSGHLLENNTFVRQMAGAVRDAGTGMVVRGNHVSSWIASNADYLGIYLTGTNAVAENNQVDLAKGVIGIRVGSVTDATRPRLINNTVSVRDLDAEAGIMVVGVATLGHNTVRTTGANAPPVLMLTAGHAHPIGAQIHGNILIAEGGERALSIEDASMLGFSDWNNLRTTGAQLVTVGASSYATLSVWQASGSDLNSVSAPVEFEHEAHGNLLLAGESLNDPYLISSFADDNTPERDIEGDARDAYNPKMGAHEGTPLPPMDNADAALGFYTAAGASPDFTNPALALAHIDRRGMKGPVTLRIRAGTFDIHSSIRTRRVGAAADDPAGSPLTLRAANFSNRPLLRHSASGASDNHLLLLPDTEYVELRALRLQAQNALYSRILVLDGDAHHVSVVDCDLESPAAGGGSVFNKAIIVAVSGPGAHLTVVDSRITGGDLGLYLAGHHPGIRIERNTFLDQATQTFSMSQSVEPIIADNFANGGPGFFISATTRPTITGNQVLASGGRALLLTGTVAGATPALVVNNTFASESNTETVYVYSNNNVVLSHLAIDQSGVGFGLRTGSTASPDVSLSNSVIRAASGAALSGGPQLPVTSLVLWSDGSFVASSTLTNYETAEAFAAANAYASDLRTFDIEFVDSGSGDLRPAGIDAWHPAYAAPRHPTVDTDLDGLARGAALVHAGAFEGRAFGPMAGGYEIYNHPDFGEPDFLSLSQAFAHLETFGITSGVTLGIRPGTHTEAPSSLGVVSGSSATNLLTLRPVDPGIYALPIIQAQPTEAANYVIRLLGTQHVLFELIGLQAMAGGGGGRVIELSQGASGASDIQLLGNDISGPTGTGDAYTLVFGRDGAGQRLRVEGVGFTGGSLAIDVEGSFAAPLEDVVISGSTVQGSGVRLWETNATISRLTVLEAPVSALVWLGSGNISRSVLTSSEGSHFTLSTWGRGQGIYVVNTFVLGGTGTYPAIFSADLTHLRHVSAIGRPAFFSSNESMNSIHNSVLVAREGATGFGPAARFTTMEPNYEGNGNLFHSGDGEEIEVMNSPLTLEEWQALSGQDDSSVYAPVEFVDLAAADLRLAGASIGDLTLAGLPLASVHVDIDGKPRSPSSPTIGAWENDPWLEVPAIYVSVRVALQGAYPSSPVQDGEADNMLTSLNALGLLPLAQPYNDVGDLPMAHWGDEAVPEGFFDDHPDIVDWVVLALRNTPSGSATARRAALLRNDGLVVDLDGESPVAFAGEPAGNKYVVVYHRNHLAVMTAAALPLTGTPPATPVNLTSLGNIYGSGAVEVEPGVVAMFAGDADGDGQVTAPDFNAFIGATAVGASGYGLPADFNMDGQVTAPDFNLFISATSTGAASTVPHPLPNR